MDMSMFTGFEGRINRAKWWLGTVILIVVYFILSLILGSIFGASMLAGLDPASLTSPDVLASWARKLAIVQLICFVIIVYPALALAIKRLNDRDRPSYFAYIFFLPSALSILAGLAGLTMTTADVGGVQMPTQSSLGWILGLLSLAIGIWALIELGILKGTTGPNQHGPDPLGGA